MTARLPLPRVWILVVLVCALIVVPLTFERVTASASSTRVAVIGDSITARYNNHPGNAKQGWWSFVGRHYRVQVETFAQSGSGYGRRGHQCTGNTFGDRLAAVRKYRPTVVFVEGGRNDWAYCRSGRLRHASNARVEKSVDSFLTELENTVPTGTKIYVLGPPWGPKDLDQRERVTAIVKASANAHGMSYISTRGSFSKDRVRDGIHPNRAGSLKLGTKVIKAVGPSLTPR